MRVILDSNVIISGFLFDGPPARLLACALDGSIPCFTSLSILDEGRNVLQRAKFGLSSDQALTLIEELHDLCTLVTPKKRVQIITADPDDNAILECALAAGADLIVSGDAHLLDLVHWEGIDILAPADALKQIHGRKEKS